MNIAEAGHRWSTSGNQGRGQQRGTGVESQTDANKQCFLRCLSVHTETEKKGVFIVFTLDL